MEKLVQRLKIVLEGVLIKGGVYFIVAVFAAIMFPITATFSVIGTGSIADWALKVLFAIGMIYAAVNLWPKEERSWFADISLVQEVPERFLPKGWRKFLALGIALPAVLGFFDWMLPAIVTFALGFMGACVIACYVWSGVFTTQSAVAVAPGESLENAEQEAVAWAKRVLSFALWIQAIGIFAILTGKATPIETGVLLYSVFLFLGFAGIVWGIGEEGAHEGKKGAHEVAYYSFSGLAIAFAVYFVGRRLSMFGPTKTVLAQFGADVVYWVPALAATPPIAMYIGVAVVALIGSVIVSSKTKVRSITFVVLLILLGLTLPWMGSTAVAHFLLPTEGEKMAQKNIDAWYKSGHEKCLRLLQQADLNTQEGHEMQRAGLDCIAELDEKRRRLERKYLPKKGERLQTLKKIRTRTRDKKDAEGKTTRILQQVGRHELLAMSTFEESDVVMLPFREAVNGDSIEHYVEWAHHGTVEVLVNGNRIVRSCSTCARKHIRGIRTLRFRVPEGTTPPEKVVVSITQKKGGAGK